jgi:putative ABC transport system permease protein
LSEKSTVPNQGGFIARLLFYFSYGFRNIQRGGRWSGLAIFCIAAGVATVVALRGLGLSIGESLVGTARSDNKGDFRLVTDSNEGPEFAMLRGAEDLRFFTDEEIAAAEAYAEERDVRISLFTTGGPVQIAGESGGVINSSQFITSYTIVPETYPAFGNIRVIEPAGATLSELFTDGNDVVISENMAEAQFLSVGDSVRVARTEEEFIVRGIVGAEAEAGFSNIFAAFFGFAYFELEDVQRAIDPEIGINNISMAFPEMLTETTARSMQEELEAFWEGRNLSRRDIDLRTAVSTLEDRQQIATVLGDFIVVMGLGALLIGGVGIMNTMLVLVRRRTNEIAALKTFGLKGGQVALLFLAESILLGIAGSVIGCVAGILLGGLVKQYGEQFIQQELAWGIYPEALLYGLSLGMLVTIIFGLVPIMSSLRIRPAIILRPNEGKVAGLGILQSLLLIIIIVVSLGLIVGQIVQPTFGITSVFSSRDAYILGVVGVAATLAFLALLNAILWVVVWLIGKLPSFGNVDLRLALRNMSSQRWRTATTLLALSAGMFALSSISFVGEGTRQMLTGLMNQSFGGNVLVFPLMPANNTLLNNIADTSYQAALSDVPGVESRTLIGTFDSELETVDGNPVNLNFNEEEINPLDTDSFAAFAWLGLTEWDSTNPLVLEDSFAIVEGRGLSEADRGQQVIIGPVDSAELLGIHIGSIVEYRIGNKTASFEVVGLYQANGNFAGSSPVIAPDALEGIASPSFQIYTFQVQDEFVPQAVTELSSISIPPTVAINVGFIDSLLQRFITQFAAIPTIVGLLSLLAAGVIMANTVALSTLERQRQIGILKALGLKSGRVLRIMLIESTIVGLLSAGLGLGLSSLIISIFSSYTGTTIPLPVESRGVAVALVIASVLIGWVSTFLSANVAVRERVMNVLRYE